MIDRAHDLPITRQAEVLNISRGSVYYLPRPVSEADLAIMRHLDRLHLEFPFAGSRMLRGLLAGEGCKIGRRHVKTLMKRMGIVSGDIPGTGDCESRQAGVRDGHRLARPGRREVVVGMDPGGRNLSVTPAALPLAIRTVDRPSRPHAIQDARMTPMTMTPTHPRFNHVVAFEVGKQTLVVHVLPADEQSTIANTPGAVRRLLRKEITRNHKASLGAMLVVCEATGGYERHVIDAAQELTLPCHRAHGSRVRFFARYLGALAKTDAIDARLLALYGLRTDKLRLYQPLSPELTALRALKARRDEINDMLIAETNRLEHAHHPRVRSGLKAHIRSLRTSITELDKEIAELLRTQALAHKARLMQSVIGVGPQTTASCLAYMPELGHLTKAEAAALAGLAPSPGTAAKHRRRDTSVTAARQSADPSTWRLSSPSGTTR
jgi:transposase